MRRLAKWGRTETIIWPPNKPIYTIGALILSVILTTFYIYCRFNLSLSPLQQYYIPYMVRSSLSGIMQKQSNYQLLLVSDGRRPRMALEGDVEEGTAPQQTGEPLPLQLSKESQAQGFRFLFRDAPRAYLNAQFHGFLARSVYQEKGLEDLFKLPLVFGLLTLLTQLPFAIGKDIRRYKELKYGRRLRGPVLLTPKQFNQMVQGDGIGLRIDGLDELVRIPARAESQHIQLIGDTGAGKTTIMFQILCQVRDRCDSAIIYDPACEFIRRFYDQARGDIVLNPFDDRCPYWGPTEELRRRSEAKTLAESLFQPDKDKKGEFFIETPQKIFAHLLTYGPSPQELVSWMSNADEIDRRVAGTEMAYMIAKGAQAQRNGVLASLGLIADSLRVLPKSDEAKGKWSATEWSKKRQGWIFITSKPTERTALRPLISLWIDLLVLRLMNEPTASQRRVWFVLDELASLQRLPQLHTAITENRKSNSPVVLGFQGKAQLEYIYGHLAEVMLSQPATNIWLKTKEPKAGQWVSEFIGKVEIERRKEMHFDGTRRGRSFSVDRQTELLVMDSEIAGLEDLHAYMKYGNYVTRFSFPYLDVPSTQLQYIERELPHEKLHFNSNRAAQSEANSASPVYPRSFQPRPAKKVTCDNTPAQENASTQTEETDLSPEKEDDNEKKLPFEVPAEEEDDQTEVSPKITVN